MRGNTTVWRAARARIRARGVPWQAVKSDERSEATALSGAWPAQESERADVKAGGWLT